MGILELIFNPVVMMFIICSLPVFFSLFLFIDSVLKNRHKRKHSKMPFVQKYFILLSILMFLWMFVLRGYVGGTVGLSAFLTGVIYGFLSLSVLIFTGSILMFIYTRSGYILNKNIKIAFIIMFSMGVISGFTIVDTEGVDTERPKTTKSVITNMFGANGTSGSKGKDFLTMSNKIGTYSMLSIPVIYIIAISLLINDAYKFKKGKESLVESDPK